MAHTVIAVCDNITWAFTGCGLQKLSKADGDVASPTLQSLSEIMAEPQKSQNMVLRVRVNTMCLLMSASEAKRLGGGGSSPEAT